MTVPKFYMNKKDMEVLIVDDNAANVFVMQKMLNLLHYKTDKAMNGLECVCKVTEKGLLGYLVILMDINMPVMNGFEASEAINKLIMKGKVSKTPIIAVTAQDETSIVEQCKIYGIVSCLFKPVKIKSLEETLNSILNTHNEMGV